MTGFTVPDSTARVLPRFTHSGAWKTTGYTGHNCADEGVGERILARAG